MVIKMNMSLLYNVIIALIMLNTIGAFVTVFRRPRSIASVFAWMMTLVFFPVFGFILYIFCGRGIDGEAMYRFKDTHRKRIREINQLIKENNRHYHQTVKTVESQLLNNYFNNVEESPLTKGNKVDFFIDGKEKFEALFKDIRAAKETVHVEYYAFFDDHIGNQFLNLLIEKAEEGVEVRLVFDPWGGKTTIKFFAPLVQAGGKVLPFITSRNIIRKTRLNYHLHRKIVVVDGKIGWTGGFNVGDQYLGGSKKFGYWRDTHARIVGTASFSLQEIFIKDWNASVKRDSQMMEYDARYFTIPTKEESGDVTMQIVADGPDTEEQILKGGFIKMLLGAEKRVWIQTPYLIPDDSMIAALVIAVRSGIDVRIMIPCMPDHPFIYRATQHYANYLQKRGVKIYIYNNGFIHAKTLIMDETISSFGTTNQDIRSYALNFEVSAFAYNQEVNCALATIFENDMKHSVELTREMIRNQSRWLRFKQNFSRLLSPIL
ncbi:cardiolipin synthase [Enterococcus camelliae]|uniref:Cardiolipin synthase n=1 Tax=Enterococcus camelliae TaxID=453959 RepID=A0ABW5TGC7_9ENTE